MSNSAIRFEACDPIAFKEEGRFFPIDKGLFVVWKSQCHPSRQRARCFNVDIVYVAPFSGNGGWRKMLRYLVSFPLTLGLLFWRRPKIVFVLNQPMLLVLAAFAFGLVTGRRYVLDGHSKPYGTHRSTVSRALYRYFTRRALFSIVHNRSDADRVHSWKGESVFLPMVPIRLEPPRDVSVDVVQPSVLVVCSFADDEPLDIFFEAARALPEVTFYMTGDPAKADASAIAKKPVNVRLTGFLPYDVYVGYLVSASLVLTMSRRPHIMQMAVDESLCYGAALVTNNSPVIMELCGDAALYADLDPSEVVSQIRVVLSDVAGHRSRMREQLKQKTVWLNTRVEETIDRFFALAARDRSGLGAACDSEIA